MIAKDILVNHRYKYDFFTKRLNCAQVNINSCDKLTIQNTMLKLHWIRNI